MHDNKLNLVVGLFVGLGSILIFVVIILLGQERSLFESTVTLYAAFDDVGGLKPGSQVRLAGVTVGTVSDIDFSESLVDKKLHVEVKVRESMLPRIRKDSIATIGTKGLLGDKVIEITIGSSDSEPFKDGSYLESEEPPDIFKILEEGQSLISNGADVMKGMKKAIAKFLDDETASNIKGIVESINHILKEVEEGGGVVHGLVYDRQVQFDLKATMSNVRKASDSTKRAIVHAENVMEEIRTGKGTIHGLIYEEDGKKIVENIQRASATIAEVVEAIKTDKGMLHTLIYEEDKGNIIRNLDEATEDIRKLAKYVEQGRGTVGGLIKDPTIYEDLKLILGNLKRNNALKALIRMSLEQQDNNKPGDEANRNSRTPASGEPRPQP